MKPVFNSPVWWGQVTRRLRALSDGKIYRRTVSKRNAHQIVYASDTDCARTVAFASSGFHHNRRILLGGDSVPLVTDEPAECANLIYAHYLRVAQGH